MQVAALRQEACCLTCRHSLLAACYAPSSGVHRGILTLIGLGCILADSLNTPKITALQACVQLHLDHLICIVLQGRNIAETLVAR